MNYGKLKERLTALLARNDLTDDLAASFIEQAIADAQRVLRLPFMERITEYEIGDVFDGLELPNDWLATIKLYAGDQPVDPVPFDRYMRTTASGGGAPRVYMRRVNQLLLKPTPAEGTTVTLWYYGEDTPMEADEDESVLAAIAPNVILNGAMVYACQWAIDDRLDAYKTAFAEDVALLQAQAVDAEFSGGPLAVEPATSYGDY